MTTPTFEVTSVYLAGFRKALVDLGQLEAVSATLSPAVKALVDAPFSNRTHPGLVLQELSNGLLKVAGTAGLEAHAYKMSRDSLGKIMLPAFKVALALTGRTPATVLARVPQSVQQALRGVVAEWLPAGSTTGTLRVTYPEAVPREAEFGWRGTLRFLFELVEGVPATISRVEQLQGGAVLVFHVSW
jgi:hypothetical protein